MREQSKVLAPITSLGTFACRVGSILLPWTFSVSNTIEKEDLLQLNSRALMKFQLVFGHRLKELPTATMGTARLALCRIYSR